jgi:AraC-like DNA-binding protein
VGLGIRTLERQFLAETGLTPGRWRRQHALLGALERLAVGTPIKQVAAAAGYATPSAFTAAFRAFFGTTPARYFAERGPGLPDASASA